LWKLQQHLFEVFSVNNMNFEANGSTLLADPISAWISGVTCQNQDKVIGAFSIRPVEFRRDVLYAYACGVPFALKEPLFLPRIDE